MEIIERPENLEKEEEIILNGQIGWCSTYDDAESVIGVKQLQNVKCFSGKELVVQNGEFPLSKAMEDKIGWCDYYASIQMLTGDTPIDLDHLDETKIVSMEGDVESKYYHRYSDYTGYLWTEEAFKCGGHDLVKILESHIGECIHMEITLYRKLR